MKIFYPPKLTITLIFILFLQASSYSNLKFESSERILNCTESEIEFTNDLPLTQNDLVNLEQFKRPFSIFQFIKWKQQKNKKLIAAVLAFPFPFGMVGLHRIYLGSAPYVPIVYIGSFGGVFGILPLLDFFAILIEKDLNTYMNNNKVFMWVK